MDDVVHRILGLNRKYTSKMRKYEDKEFKKKELKRKASKHQCFFKFNFIFFMSECTAHKNMNKFHCDKEAVEDWITETVCLSPKSKFNTTQTIVNEI